MWCSIDRLSASFALLGVLCVTKMAVSRKAAKDRKVIAPHILSRSNKTKKAALFDRFWLQNYFQTHFGNNRPQTLNIAITNSLHSLKEETSQKQKA